MSDATAMCSQCGYDLRGIGSERCPECGFELSLQPMLSGEIPWTYRLPRGRVRTFFETVWHVTAGRAWIERVVETPVSLKDARRFWLIASSIASLPLLAALVYAWARLGGSQFLMYLPDATEMATQQSGWQYPGMPTPFDASWPVWVRTELAWPLSAGLSRPGMPLVAIWLFVLMGSGAPGYLFHPRQLSAIRRQRANAFSHYLCAPLVYAAVPLLGVIVAVAYAIEVQASPFSTPIYAGGLCAIVLLMALELWMVRVLRTLRATTACSPRRIAVAALLLPAMWIGAAFFVLVLVPWCVGVAWLLFDALRR